jgi:hypothetical protein
VGSVRINACGPFSDDGMEEETLLKFVDNIHEFFILSFF